MWRINRPTGIFFRDTDNPMSKVVTPNSTVRLLPRFGIVRVPFLTGKVQYAG